MPQLYRRRFAGLAHLVGRATGQSLTSGNRIEPLVVASQAYPAMLAAIESARYSVLASYIFDSQGIGGAVRRCAAPGSMRRGVQGAGADRRRHARWTPRSAYRALAARRRSGGDVQPDVDSRAPACRASAQSPQAAGDRWRDGFTGGMNIFRSVLAARCAGQACHDLHFRLRGPVVAHLMRCFTDGGAIPRASGSAKGLWGEPPATADEQGTSWARGIRPVPMRPWTGCAGPSWALSVAKHSVRIWTHTSCPISR